MSVPAEITTVPMLVAEGGQPVQRTPLDMLNMAVARGDTTMVKDLIALHKEWDAHRARKAFDDAIGAAKAEIPVINKNRVVDFTSPKGRTHYRHEDLAEIARTVDPILARHGLSYRFRVSSAVNEPVSVTCILSHRDGHSEECTLHAGRDESGNKNSIQGVGSTITYLQRYTLKSALGLAAAEDDDGKAVGDGGPISEDQKALILALIEKVGPVSEVTPRFCRAMKVERIEDIPASRYDAAVAKLNEKIGGGK